MWSQLPTEAAPTVYFSCMRLPVLTPEKRPPCPPCYHGHRSGGPKIVAGGDVHAAHADGSGNGALSLEVERCSNHGCITRWLVWEEEGGNESGHVRPVGASPAPRRSSGESRRGRSQPFTRENPTCYQPLPDRGQPSIQTSTWLRCGGDTSASFTFPF